MRNLCLVLLLSIFLSSYNLQSVQTYKGYIVSVQKYNLVNKPAPYIQFILNSKGIEYTVELGPEWYISEQGAILLPHEEVEVTGSMIKDNNQKIILATRIKRGNIQIKLRQEDGVPLWP